MDETRSKFSLTNPFSENRSFLESLSRLELDEDTNFTETQEVLTELDLNVETSLPIQAYSDEITKSIRENRCIIITGSTGCGKTTQLPKFIIKDCLENKTPFNILVSQPRKIAAITNSSRVAQELKVPLGSLVGFQVSLHRELNKAGQRTKLLYCTTGVILQKLIQKQKMNMYTHIVLDEIHERDIEMDFLLILVRQYLNTSSKDTKVILMSATMDSQRFANYFKRPSFDVPIINMKEQRIFSITKRFLDDVSQNNSKLIDDYEKPGISEDMMALASEIIFEHVKADNKSSILVFLPGFWEIENFEVSLRNKFDVLQNFELIVLHSSLPPESQKRAFKCDDRPKIILSTNIAENSVTIPKVNVVVDFCLTKYLVASTNSNLASLELNWTSKMSSEQRAGRTGRVCDGTVYHLVPKAFYDRDMEVWTRPEMCRVPLERVILKTKLLTQRSPKNFLAAALDPPKFENVRNSVMILKEVGALHRYDENGNFQCDDGELTFCGRILASLPCDIYVGKFILLGYMFSVLDEAIVIGAGLAINGSIFKTEYKKRIETYSNRLSWSDGSGSDLIAIYNAYELWRRNKEQGNFKTAAAEQRWHEAFHLDVKNLTEMRELIDEIKHRLEENFVFVIESAQYKPILEGKEKTIMLKLCIAGAWLPYYFLLEPFSNSSEHATYREVNSLNVNRTIMFKDRDQKYSSMYNDLLKQSLVDRGICQKTEDVHVSFDRNRSSKILVSFMREETLEDRRDGRGIMLVAGTILPEVYIAIKYKELNHANFYLNVMDQSSMIEYAKQIGYSEEKQKSQTILNMSTTSVYTQGQHEMSGVITHIVHCSKFYFHPTGSKYNHDNKIMDFKLKTANLGNPISHELELTDGAKVVINYDNKRQRGIVIKPNKDKPIEFALIDSGIVTKDIELDRVYHCSKQLKPVFDRPPRCFECTLKEISPSFFKCPQGVWTVEANDAFRKIVKDKEVRIEIFSVVDEVVSVTLYAGDVNVNDELVELQFARHCEEELNSRLNNKERLSSSKLSFRSSTMTTFDRDEDVVRSKRLLPPQGLTNMSITLNGPLSPLETSLRSVLVEEDHHQITIDAYSVNSVILNGDVNDVCTRMYVASNVTINRNKGITLRELTMLPNIRGLPEILALIFSPKMIIRLNAEKTRYKTLQTGLGCNPVNGEGLLPLHDAIFDVNVQLSEKDFIDINELRECMSELVFAPPTSSFPQLTSRTKYELQMKINNLILSILHANRMVLPPCDEKKEYSWIESEKDVVKRTEKLGQRAMYQAHSYPKLKETPKKFKLNDIDKITKADSKLCRLCNKEFVNKRDAADHFDSVMHKANIKQFFLTGKH